MGKAQQCSDCRCHVYGLPLQWVEWTDKEGVYHSATLCDECYDVWADTVGEREDD